MNYFIDDDNLPKKRGMGMRIQRRNSIPRICGKKAVYVSFYLFSFLPNAMRVRVFAAIRFRERRLIAWCNNRIGGCWFLIVDFSQVTMGLRFYSFLI